MQYGFRITNDVKKMTHKFHQLHIDDKTEILVLQMKCQQAEEEGIFIIYFQGLILQKSNYFYSF